jgi:hypothetical protein
MTSKKLIMIHYGYLILVKYPSRLFVVLGELKLKYWSEWSASIPALLLMPNQCGANISA